MDIHEQIISAFNLDKRDPNSIPALTLAYLGDCIYELAIRTLMVERGISHVSDLNKAVVGLVKATAQRDMLHAIEDGLTEAETAVYKRGRNVKSSSCPKGATVADYHTATGFEALMGYLYVTGQTQRLLELVESGLKEI